MNYQATFQLWKEARPILIVIRKLEGTAFQDFFKQTYKPPARFPPPPFSESKPEKPQNREGVLPDFLKEATEPLSLSPAP